MKSIGIICEYNPFHNGHKRQIDILREKFPEALIVAIMSGNFVQRGDAAIFDKYLRAEAAVSCGADLCVGIPFVFSSLSAEGFARAGVTVAESLGLDAVSFGTECDSTDALERIADFSLSDGFSQKITEKCKEKPELSLMRAGALVIEEKLGREYANIVSQPNNILAIEYIKAIKKEGLGLQVIPVLREGEGYKSLNVSPLPSATFVREQIINKASLAEFVPEKALGIYERAIKEDCIFDCTSFSRFVTAYLSLLTYDRLERSAGSAELASRLQNALSKAVSFEELISLCTTSRYTRARIRRAVISSLFDVAHNEFMHERPRFAQLLSANRAGREHLSGLRGSDFPVITKNADYVRISNNSEFKRQFELEMKADGIWAQFQKKPMGFNHFVKKSPVITEG